LEESAQSSSEADSISSAEIACWFMLPNTSDCDNYNTNWVFGTPYGTHTPWTSSFQPNWSSAQCLDLLSSNVEVGVESDFGLNCKRTIFYLKDIPSNALEENPAIDDITACNTTTDTGLSTADQHNL